MISDTIFLTVPFITESDFGKLPNYVIGDQVRLNQIMINLIGNAFKFTKKGFVKFKITILDKTEKNLYIEFRVIDTGIGMTQDELTKIFARFSQADVSTTRKYGGSGLGLTICKGLVELMNGKIEAKSEKNIGSEFFFELNLPIVNDFIEEENHENEINTDDLEKLKLKKILIAEDNKANQKLISFLMKRKELDFKICENGRETLDEIDANPDYDVILMDGQMPVMDGLEATRTIRSLNESYSNIPIIALTASALIGDRQKFIDSGMDDYVTKPINEKRLFSVLIKYTIKFKR
ncbi:MAG: ATP-binding protein [Candidatus Delongbacteria bacterium]|jgi:CheY-like chemotaxis protein|nr:ATP-binding protein [Candidatus Delongbacteria bacterium]